MKTMIPLLLQLFSILLLFTTCTDEAEDGPIPELNPKYEACCGTEPVEFELDTLSSYVYVPNVFVPNGQEANATFKPYVSDNIDIIMYMTIFRDTDSTFMNIYEAAQFPIEELDEKAWDGRHDNGDLYTGPFEYEIFFGTESGDSFIVRGSCCAVSCEADAEALTTDMNCYFPEQYDSASSELDEGAPVTEDCF